MGRSEPRHSGRRCCGLLEPTRKVGWFRGKKEQSVNFKVDILLNLKPCVSLRIERSAQLLQAVFIRRLRNGRSGSVKYTLDGICLITCVCFWLKETFSLAVYTRVVKLYKQWRPFDPLGNLVTIVATPPLGIQT